MRIAVVGSTGMVGRIMLEELSKRNISIDELIPVASARSIGKEVTFKEKKHLIVGIEKCLQQKPDIAIFSAGSDVSKEWAPKFAEVGTTVIDNSSAWRADKTKKLIIPEINAHLLTKEDKIIANPNCSTIQLVMVLNPINRIYGLKRVVVSTYQSVSGSGIKAVKQMEDERKTGKSAAMVYPYIIDQNCIPHCDEFEEDGYTKEEKKLMTEPFKIMGTNDFTITATAVRVPVTGGHSEAVNVELNKEANLQAFRTLLAKTPGLQLQDNSDLNIYPMPYYAKGKSDVFVGRIRRDASKANSYNLWIVSDNLRKGAATNAVQIAEYIINDGLVGK